MAVRNVVRLALIGLIGLGVALFLGYREHLGPDALQAQLGQLGPWAPLALVAVWLVAPVLFVPGAPITLAAGALFGPLLGTAYSLIGATGGATLAFLLARYTGSE